MSTKKQKQFHDVETHTLNPTRFLPSTDKQTRDESTLRLTRALTHAECATVLHGLRTIQADGRIEGCAAGMCDHFEDVEPLTNDHIDELCEAINLQPSAVPVAVSESNTWTPGPWFVGTGWVGAGDVKDGRVIARVEGYPYGNTEANLRLMAAAPDLLRALEGMITAWSLQFENELDNDPAAVAAMAARAKAVSRG